MSRALRFMVVLLVFTSSQLGILGQESAELKLQKWLQKFTQENSVTNEQLNAMLGSYVLGSQAMRKGGLGIVDRETYIVLDEPRNAVIVGGKQWDGLSREKAEVVLTDGRHILGSVPTGELGDLRILIFAPKEVQFINPSTNSGGIYRRLGK